MSSALSVDLRERVVHAVEAGASRHQAAERFRSVWRVRAAGVDGSPVRATSHPNLWAGINARIGSRLMPI